jgi:cell division protein FtsA
MTVNFLYNGNIPVGGINITKDIVLILGVDFNIAEKIKALNTDLTLNSNEEEELIKIEITNNTSFKAIKITRKIINNIYKARIEEIIRIIYDKLSRQKFEGFIRNIVITGGSALTPGLDAFVNKITKKHVRIGYPNTVVATTSDMTKNLQNPIYSCSIGTLKFLQKISQQKKLDDFKSTGFTKFKKLFHWMNRFLIS